MPQANNVFEDPFITGGGNSFNLNTSQELQTPFKIEYLQDEPKSESSRNSKDSLFRRIQVLLQQGKAVAAVRLAILQGIRDENQLSDIIFQIRHPERGSKRIGLHERQLITEWLDIKNRIVKPALSSIAYNDRPKDRASTTGMGGLSQSSLGTLTLMVGQNDLPSTLNFTYRFTPEDAIWTVRFILGEAGGRDDPDNHAVIWAMFNRYAFFTRYGSPWKDAGRYKTFHEFLRNYSTPLQWPLRSWHASSPCYE